MDTSWALTWDETSILIDPWLVGSEIDGFGWFNEQWHATAPVAIRDLGNYSSILVSQKYSDHCHQQTLQALDHVPLIVTPSAAKRVTREMPASEIQILPELCSGKWLERGGLKLAYLDPGRLIDPIYNGVVIRRGQEVVVYFPHGFILSTAQLGILKTYDILMLITSFSTFRLPFFLGGSSNPGKENALHLVEILNPRKVVHTHDENKHARGLVKKIAKVDYPDPAALEASMGGRFVYLQYEALSL